MRGAMTGKSGTYAIIVAAGQGVRAGGDVPKQFRRVAGKTVLAHAWSALATHPAIDGVVLVIGAGQEIQVREALGDSLPALVTGPAIVIGGASRRESVLAGIDYVAAIEGADRVLIHDAARPFLSHSVIDRLLAGLDSAPGVIPALPVADTLARGNGLLGEMVDRTGLFHVQTPQAFHLPVIMAAHRDWDAAAEPTDDAQMVRGCGYDVIMVEGDRMLDKLTLPADFEAAEARHGRRSVRTGMGYDVHRLVEGEDLWLGGVLIPHDKGLAGHSDADVALHALVDALLGAIAEGDIGSHFPPSDPQWRGAASSWFVEHARSLVAARGGRIEHVDLTIICEAPKIGPHRDTMRAGIAAMLDIALHRVSVKATTTERLGFTGRGEGIAAQAVATVSVQEHQ